MEIKSHMRGDNIYFYEIGLGGMNEENNKTGWSMRTFRWLREEFGELEVG